MNNSLENRTVVSISSSVENKGSVAQAVCAVNTNAFAHICPDGMPAEVEGRATVGASALQFPMVGAGLANIRNEM